MEETRSEAPGLSVEELTKLFSVLSHDLKSPIFAIDGFSDLLLGDYSDKVDEEGQDFLRRIRSSVQQMKKVLDEMSQMVKLLSRPSAKHPVPLHEIVEEVILKCNYSIEEGGVRVDVPAELPVIDVDHEKMRAALGAMMGNALFFNDRPKGERTIALDCVPNNGSGWRISVRDNGIGIDPRYTGQIFELGLKLDKSRGGGPGYGLFLARKVAEEHGGTLTVESAPGEGSTFTMTLP